MLDQRRRRWADAVQMLYKFFVFAGNALRSTKLQMLPNAVWMLDQRRRLWANVMATATRLQGEQGVINQPYCV